MLIMALIFVTVVFQATLAGFLSISGIAPNILIILFAFLAFYQPFSRFLFLVFLGGVLLDVFSPLPYGFVTITFLSFPAIIQFLLSNIFEEISFKSIFTVSFSFTFSYYIILFVLLSAFSLLNLLDYQPDFSFNFLKTIILSALYNGVIAGLMFPLIRKTGIVKLRRS